jgi:hypothetical protein
LQKQCEDFMKQCRDVNCAFREYKVDCNASRVWTCTCGTLVKSDAVRVQPAHALALGLLFAREAFL